MWRQCDAVNQQTEGAIGPIKSYTETKLSLDKLPVTAQIIRQLWRCHNYLHIYYSASARGGGQQSPNTWECFQFSFSTKMFFLFKQKIFSFPFYISILRSILFSLCSEWIIPFARSVLNPIQHIAKFWSAMVNPKIHYFFYNLLM